MANRFELYGEKKGYDNLYDYVKYLGWWNKSEQYMNGKNKPNQEIINSVKDVLINGNRPMPIYVDEHDCISCGSSGYDIIKLEIDGKIITDKNELLNKSNYIKDKTIIYNRYGSVYTFYTFPTEKSDPFGYTEKALKNTNS